MENVTTRKWSVELRAKERFADPRICQVDLNPDWVNTSQHPDKSIHSDRVMPMVNYGKFCRILMRKTKTLRQIDDSHFWVSGYYAIYFYLASKKDRMKIKSIVRAAVIESGGFMNFDNWYKEHAKPRMRMVQYNGTGRGITQTSNNLHNHIAFL